MPGNRSSNKLEKNKQSTCLTFKLQEEILHPKNDLLRLESLSRERIEKLSVDPSPVNEQQVLFARPAGVRPSSSFQKI